MIRQLSERYRRWESRHARRFSGWPVRRRWLVFVLVPTLLVCGVGTVVGIPLAWVARTTIKASRGAPSPDAAANVYLMALSYGDETGLLPVLDNEHQDELLRQWREYRDAMRGTDPAPSRLDFGALTVGPIAGGRAQVSTDVAATWWSDYRSQTYPWRFTTREDNGWQVSAVDAPAWCGGYVLASKCQTR